MRAVSEIAGWYRGRSVFITGATGFLGKVLVEKLLRSCPEVGPIYLLLRKKRNTSFRERIDDMTKSCLFDRLRTAGVNPKNKLIPISGDIALPNLGISDEDRRVLQDKVSVVFHVAATIKFDEPLPVAMKLNFEGTKSVMQLCQGMTSLSAIVHVSTAYANCTLPLIEESIYPPPMDPEKVLHCVAGMDEDVLDYVTPRLLGKYPNTYTFTKALAEQLVAQYSSELPIAVVRPSIVTSSWKEPIPGWIDSPAGTTIYIVAASKGIRRCVYGIGELGVDIIPVDVCANLFISAAWEMGNRDDVTLKPGLYVYNCVSGPFKPISWNDLYAIMDTCMTKFPSSGFLTIPSLKMTPNKAMHLLSNIPEQIMIALADAWIRFNGEKPRFQSYRRKIDKQVASVEFFMTNEFRFNANNVAKLNSRLSPADRVIFHFDMSTIDWKKYGTNYSLGIRRYLLNEKDETILTCGKRVTRWRWIRNFIQIGTFLSLLVASINSISTIP